MPPDILFQNIPRRATVTQQIQRLRHLAEAKSSSLAAKLLQNLVVIEVPERLVLLVLRMHAAANATANATQTDKDVWWESLRSVMPPVLELEPLRAGSCQAPAAGRCVGTAQSGDCVCYG